MKLERFQIETMRGVLKLHWQSSGHSDEAPDALCDMALASLNEAPRLPPSDSLELIDGNELHALQRDKALLDWCEKNLTIIRDIGWLSGKDLRAAIDAEIARRSTWT